MSSEFPPGWDAERVRRVVARYEEQTDAETAAEDTAALRRNRRTVMSGRRVTSGREQQAYDTDTVPHRAHESTDSI
jgi:hypothetical protein